RPSTPVDSYYPVTPEARFLKEHNSPDYRALLAAPGFMQKGWDSYTTLLFNAKLLHGLNSANIYHSLVIKDYSDVFADFGDVEERKMAYRGGLSQLMWTHRSASPLMDILAVRYIISALPLYDPVNDVERLTKRLTGANYSVYERPDPMPRAFFVSRAEFLDRNRIHARLRAIARGDFTQQQLRRYALVDEASMPPGMDLLVRDNVEAVPVIERFVPAQISRDAFSRLTVNVDAPSDGWLVLSDV